MKTLMKVALGATLAAMALSAPAFAQGTGDGLVGTHCKAEIAKYCADIPHGQGAVPKCLTEHKAELSQQCQWALENKGPGWGQGQGMGGMGGMAQ